ncbi:hypothetical protein [Nitrosospira briensis]|uniref:hypothetical protein n=1 Tax=Nitrosospira briensis TaxID=35799 RepID=UPI0008EC05A0|nr:hypothetical protein [Nitrosospira briensis]SFO19675.1 hypothetical protein SAMN05216332_10777 [Nitrosospira briensis]
MEKPDPDNPGKPEADALRGPGGLTLHEIHAQVKLSTARDRADSTQHEPRQAVSRWRQITRWAWGKNKGRS